jgi:Cu2+-exporting ATPase
MLATAARPASPVTPPACAHCGLPVPAGLIDPDAGEQFCCAGCRTVRAAIESCGLGQYYGLKDGVVTPPARPSGRAYAELDDVELLARHAPVVAPGLRTVELRLEGVHCSACVWLLEKLPRVLPGVMEARLDLRQALLRVTWAEATQSLSHIARTLDGFGYRPHVGRDPEARRTRQREDRRFLVRIGIAGAGAGNVMLLAFALYGGHFHGMEGEWSRLFRWASLLIGLVVLFGPGAVFLRGAFAAVRTRSAHLDLPIGIGLLAGAVAGTINTLLDRGEIYFDSLTGLVFLLLVGRFVQRRFERRAADAVETLFSLTPGFARRRQGAELHEVPIDALAAGDVVEVRPGESFPADGLVSEGDSAMNLALLTGESRPLPVRSGDAVYAGAVNVGGGLAVRITTTGRATRVGKLLALVEEAGRRKAPIVQLADRWAGWFTVAAIALSLGTLVAWLFIDPAHAIDHAVSLLIVSCPCGLGLATPFAVSVALGRAARAGIMIKGGEVLEKLARARTASPTLFLDKTGTLTEERLAVVAWHEAPDGVPVGLRGWVARLEAQASHPIAYAFAAEAGQANESSEVDESGEGARPSLLAAHANGLEGRVRGQTLLVGSARFVSERLRGLPPWAEATGRLLTSVALTPVWVALAGRLAAVAGVGGRLRADAKATVADFRRRGMRVAILSGDHPETVRAVGVDLGLPPASCHGGLAPEDKVAAVAAAAAEGPVVMVGDGVNDAAALAAATVGIAVHGGAEASLAAADAYLGRPGVAPLTALFVGAERTLAVIRRCLLVSFAYNVVAAALAVTGVVNALQAAVLMPLASFTVLGLALWLRTFDDAQTAVSCP